METLVNAIGFTAPWALAGLAVLPALWWLVRLVPPAPYQVRFPAVRLLAGLGSDVPRAARSPWWLTALRLALALLVVAGAAGPYVDRAPPFAAPGPVLLFVDDGWAAARDWPERRRRLAELIDRAERQGRAVILVPTAPRAEAGAAPRPQPAREARARAEALVPQPWPVNRRAALDALGLPRTPPGPVFWLSDGLDGDGEEMVPAGLRRFGPLTVVRPEGTARLLDRPRPDGSGLTVSVRRAGGGPAAPVAVVAFADDGRPLARLALAFAAGAERAEGHLALPPDLQNRLVRLAIDGESTAGAVVLTDDRGRHRTVGVASPAVPPAPQPVLDEGHYLDKALAPFAEVRHGSLDVLLDGRPAALMVVDAAMPREVGPREMGSGEVGPGEAGRDRLRAWVEAGGVLVRFAGPRLARSPDDLVPAAVRPGDRTTGGALSWAAAPAVAPFPDTGPFAGLVPPVPFALHRQILARPSMDLPARTWARLEDGTPLVTGNRLGQGWLVLIHVSADPTWSDLPLSGTFVDMLRRLVELAGSPRVPDAGVGEAFEPEATLDGFGRVGPPPASAHPLAAAAWATTAPGPAHPPGLWRRGDGRRAFNLSDRIEVLRRLEPPAGATMVTGRTVGRAVDLQPWLLGAALLLLVVDGMAVLALRGGVRPAAGAALGLTAALAAGLVAGEGAAGDVDPQTAALTTRLAFVRTGEAVRDATSRAGLNGLTRVLNQRTAAELGAPVAVDPATDELAFFPLLFWSPGGAVPDARAVRRLADYRAHGGLLVFDGAPGDDAAASLAEVARRLDLPPLVPAEADHLLGRSFYLLPDFPGRVEGTTVWVEPAGERLHDGVGTVVAGRADWTGAWAVDEAFRPLYLPVPAGERQRETAYRVGVNLVMMALTGSYKADQVHLRPILERLGR